jgi:hypothetical protein
MSADPVRIEIRGLRIERDEAQRDLRETLDALGERLMPARAAQRLVRQNDPRLVIAGVLAVGAAIGLARDRQPIVRAGGVVAAGTAVWLLWRMVSSRREVSPRY